MDEFRHRCAICGADRPQIHHIDGDPSNNNVDNLLPLCPNHHLTDQHNPTAPFDPEKLALFRHYKDPAILGTKFEPLFRRMKFLRQISDTDPVDQLSDRVDELLGFVAHLKMGPFYRRQIDSFVKKPRRHAAVWGRNSTESEKAKVERDHSYRAKLRRATDQVEALVVELLRYQGWCDD